MKTSTSGNSSSDQKKTFLCQFINRLAGNGVNPLLFNPSADFQDFPNDLDWFFQDVLKTRRSAASEDEAVPEPIGMFPYFQQELDLALDSTSGWMLISSILRSSLEGRDFKQSVLQPNESRTILRSLFQQLSPHFPFLHRPGLVRIEMPPLLLVAIIALGATLSDDSTNFEIATKVHDYLHFRMCRVSQYHSLQYIFSHINNQSETFQRPAPL